MPRLWLIVYILVFLVGVVLFFLTARLAEGNLYILVTLTILGALFMVATIVLTMARLGWWYGQQEAQEQQNGGI